MYVDDILLAGNDISVCSECWFDLASEGTLGINPLLLGWIDTTLEYTYSKF